MASSSPNVASAELAQAIKREHERAERRRANKSYKRLVVFCDGTGQQTDSPTNPPKKEPTATSKAKPSTVPKADDLPIAKASASDLHDYGGWVPASNVTRMSRCLEDAEILADQREIEQLSFYQNGVATGALGWFTSAWNGAFGIGVNENITEVYIWLCQNWIPGDEIFLFGFSRGAYTARAVAGLVHHLGLLDRANLDNFHRVYHLFQMRDQKDHKQDWEKWADSNLSTAGRNANNTTKPDPSRPIRAPGQVMLKVVGVFDTVQSQGIPRTRWMKNISYNKKYAFHDAFISNSVENAFHVLALDEFRPSFSPTLWFKPTDGSNHTVLRQTWFCGAHSDAGGSYDDAEPYDTSDLSLLWMLEQTTPFLKWNMAELRSTLHRENDIERQMPPDAVKWVAAQPLHNSMTAQFIAAGSETRTPGRYTMERVLKPSEVGESNERVHWSVRLRLLQAKYGRGVRTHRRKDAGWFGWVPLSWFGWNDDGVERDGNGKPVWDVAKEFECDALKGFRLERREEKWVWVKDNIKLEEDPLCEMDRQLISDEDVPLLRDVSKSIGLHF